MIKKTNIDLSISPKKKNPLTVGVQLSSYDKNFHEFEISFLEKELKEGDAVDVLTVFESSKRVSESNTEIKDGSAFFSFDTTLIDRDEVVTNYVYLKSGDSQAEVGAFRFDVKLSEIDKGARVTAKAYDESYETLIQDFEKELRDHLSKLEDIDQEESIRQDEEEVRKLAEADRVTSEDTRKASESVRMSNEEERELNEAERILKDSERDSKIEEIERVATEPLKPIHTLKVENEVFSSDEVSVSEGIITINNHNLKVGDKVAFVATATPYGSSESFEGAMRLNTVYYVVNLSNDSFQISTTKNGEPMVFNMDTKGFLWQFEKVSVNSLQVSGLDGTKYRAVFTGAHEGNSASRRLMSVYTNPGNNGPRYSTKDLQHTITATDVNPVHGVMDIYSEMFFKVINRKILITVNSSFTTIGETNRNHIEETYSNRILTKTANPVVGFQDSINVIGVGPRHLFDGSTLEVYEA